MAVITSEPKGERFLELDYLRGLAAISVVLFHYTFGYDNGLRQLDPNKFYFRYGNLGVQLFFIISGFVILMTLEKTKSSMDFFVSRFSRLYPTYWGAILITLIFVSLFSGPFNYDKFTTTQVAVNLTMLQHWFKIKDIDGAYWTLSVELTFYVLMWIAFYFKKLKHIEILCFGWLILALLNQVTNLPYKNILQQVFILQFAPMFVAGVVFYNVKSRNGYNMFRGFLHVFSFVVEGIILYKTTNSILPIVILSTFYIVFFLLVTNVLVVGKNKILGFFGGISYSLYLIHENIGETIMYHLKKIIHFQIIYVSISMLIVFLMAYLLTIYIEKPSIKLIRSYYKNTNRIEAKN